MTAKIGLEIQKINRQPSKTEYFYPQPSNDRAKISRQISFFKFFKIFLKISS